MSAALIGGGIAAQGLSGLLSAWATPDINPAEAAKGAFSNRFGEVGQAAANRAQNAFANLGNTAGANFAANSMNALGSSALGSAQKSTDIAAKLSMKALGNQRRGAFDLLKRSGASPASMAGIASRLAEGNASTLTGLAGQGAQNAQGAINQAASAFAQGQQIKQSDLAQQFGIAQSQLADFNSTLYNAELEKQMQPDAWQGLGQGLALGLSQAGSMATKGGMQMGMGQMAYNQAANNSMSESYFDFLKKNNNLPKFLQ